MTTELKQHYLKRVRLRYHSGSKTQKSLILDEFCEVCSISRKHAIRLMNEDLRENPVWPGRRRVYGADVDRHLRHLWECMGRINSKKMETLLIIKDFIIIFCFYNYQFIEVFNNVSNQFVI